MRIKRNEEHEDKRNERTRGEKRMGVKLFHSLA